MPIGICVKCDKPCPDSFHEFSFKEKCHCKSKEEWIKLYKKNNWCLLIDGEEYDFTKKKK